MADLDLNVYSKADASFRDRLHTVTQASSSDAVAAEGQLVLHAMDRLWEALTAEQRAKEGSDGQG